MIHLRPSKREELKIFDAMDHQEHARNFVNHTGLETHQKNFDNPQITYPGIENSNGEFPGYFILVLESDSKSVEFRRVLIDQQKRGIGQAAIIEMEHFCKNKLNVKRIWLDVYGDNEIGIHIYEKMGYERFNEKPVGGGSFTSMKNLYKYMIF